MECPYCGNKEFLKNKINNRILCLGCKKGFIQKEENKAKYEQLEIFPLQFDLFN